MIKLKQIYDDIIIKIEESLNKDDFDTLDYLLEYIYSSGEINEEIIDEIDDILQEVTLYIEFKEADYKEMALNMIEEVKEEIK